MIYLQGKYLVFSALLFGNNIMPNKFKKCLTSISFLSHKYLINTFSRYYTYIISADIYRISELSCSLISQSAPEIPKDTDVLFQVRMILLALSL